MVDTQGVVTSWDVAAVGHRYLHTGSSYLLLNSMQAGFSLPRSKALATAKTRNHKNMRWNTVLLSADRSIDFRSVFGATLLRLLESLDFLKKKVYD